ncbi:fatty acid desaturase family protein [Sphingomonas sp. FW199]|uniref:fatty acid desaturase family protein n=1 Tax=Sphingomonas sp. FW199 TaxID=3400217 RepID=UPI003CFA4266
MNAYASLDRRDAERVAVPAGAGMTRGRVADDRQMLRTAAELSRDLHRARPAIYWTDLIASALLGYAALALAIGLSSGLAALAAATVAVFALYRAESFIHELTHVKHDQLPGFRTGWNLLIGIPLFVPSFLYEGVHQLHHARQRYGTAQDPEYLPLALMKPWSVPLFVLVSALAPLALMVRFAVLTPLAALFPAVRNALIHRWSALSINPDFRRRMPEGPAARQWRWQAAGASLWANALIAGMIFGVIPVRAFVIFMAVLSMAAVVNQVRTLVAHLWENDGEELSLTAQYLDSVNVPPPGLLPFLWAPVGLRYHALHHLLPGVPYHSLGEAHRRLARTLEPDSAYHRANYAGLAPLVGALVAKTVRRG